MSGDLLVDVQRRIEALYAVEPQAPVTEFLVTDTKAGSRTLLRQDGDDLALGVVIDDDVRRHLTRDDPRVRLDRSKLDPFFTLTEEISHFV
jgi:hypothetical protein